jgi:uncharacterized protein YukE
MALTEKELLRLKEDVSDAKTRASELNGQKQAIMQQFNDLWNCKSIEDVDKKLDQIRKNRDALDEKIETLSEKLEEELNSKEHGS